MIKSFNMIIFLFGIILVVIGYTHNIKEECHPKIEYRFIPKDTYENLLYDNDVTESVWKDMSNDDYMHNYSDIKAYNEDDII
jgi:predicted membrane protein